MDNNEFIKSDEYFLFYEMMIEALETDDVIKGVNKSLYLLKLFLSSGNIILYKKNENGKYVYDICDVTMHETITEITSLVNTISYLVENLADYEIDFNITDTIKNIKFLYIKSNDCEYILSICNYNAFKELDADFWKQLCKTMHVIMKRAESYEKNIRAITTDVLTGLDNRNSYEMRIKEIKEQLVYGVFDLFRLKYVNDHYSHIVGDDYIMAAARILKKYWPKHKIKLDNEIETKVETGHCVYRTGGDEFILLTTKESIERTKIKAKLAAREVSMINLGVEALSNEQLLLGLNHGIIIHEPNRSIKETSKLADELMEKDKTLMYQKFKINRRQH